MRISRTADVDLYVMTASAQEQEVQKRMIYFPSQCSCTPFSLSISRPLNPKPPHFFCFCTPTRFSLILLQLESTGVVDPGQPMSDVLPKTCEGCRRACLCACCSLPCQRARYCFKFDSIESLHWTRNYFAWAHAAQLHPHSKLPKCSVLRPRCVLQSSLSFVFTRLCSACHLLRHLA